MKKAQKLIFTILTGVASGAIAGLLLAPRKGSETRRKISRQGGNYIQKMRKNIDKIRTQLNKKIKKADTEIDQIGEKTERKGDELVKKAKKLTSLEGWTKEELYQRAKEENIDGYSTMKKTELLEALKKN